MAQDSTRADGAGPTAFDRDVTTALVRSMPAFAYDFGAYGWPSGWSPYGLAPQWVRLEFDELVLNDLVTGRPQYDLLPASLVSAPEVQRTGLGAPVRVSAATRAHSTSSPLTELHYQTGDGGLQRTTIMHVQGRGPVEGMLAYAGAGARGEYPGSRLRRHRQLVLRSRFRGSGEWLAEVRYLHTQRRLGAHGGVIGPTPYNRLIAGVRQPGAVRRMVRNDLQLRFSGQLWGGALEAGVSWSEQTLRFTSTDTTASTVSRVAVNIKQQAYGMSWELHPVLGPFLEMHATVRDSLAWGRLSASVSAGLHALYGARYLSGAAVMHYRGFFVEAVRSGQPLSWVARNGWGRYLRGSNGLTPGRLHQVHGGVGGSTSWIGASISGFARLYTDMVDWHVAGPDSVAARSAGSGASGVAGRVGFRDEAVRGLYADVAQLVLWPTGRETGMFMHGRLGIRYALFSRDLLLNLSVRYRYWRRLQERGFHAPTGLLAVTGRALPASGGLDAVCEATVRGATLLVSMENILSGTPVLEGNQMIPGYPLPAQFLRFGIFWPILN